MIALRTHVCVRVSSLHCYMCALLYFVWAHWLETIHIPHFGDSPTSMGANGFSKMETLLAHDLWNRWYGVRAWQMVDRGHRLRQQQLLGDFLSSFQIQPPPDQTRQTIGRFVWTAACKQSTLNFHTIALWRRMLASCFSFSAPFIFLADHLSKEARIANRRTLGLCIGSAAQKNLHIRRI